MKKENQKIKNKIQLIIGLILIISGLILYLMPYIKTEQNKKIENSKIKEYIKGININNNEVEEQTSINNEVKTNKDINYFMILEIPKINLKKGLYSINSKYNKVDYGIEVLKESEMPNKEGSNLILASHSGNSRIAYFKHLNRLIIGDKVYIYYDGIKYEYKISDFYQKEKDGTISIDSSKDTRIILITCVDNEKQLIYTGILNNKENY